jgi:hypothetical protein
MPEDEPAASGITVKLATGIRQRAVGLAFGDTQTVGDLHIVPVAFVGYGFGALDHSSERFSAGGGGGGFSFPLGVYVTDHGSVRFRANTVAVLALIVPIASAVTATLARVATARRP